ncbi:hypothetical protein [Niabella sp.]|uniref:hypothetical protein n=1 Tax=Niabella sp. TaxID=1962976 RepID=UPI0026225034|nr:hypothetical protein [Niabella sp.]
MANYPLSQLTTAEDCDALINIAEKERKDMEWKKLNLLRLKDQYSNNAFVNATELGIRKKELENMDTVIATLPDGTYKTEQIKKRTTAWYKVFLLENRKTSFGDVAVIEKIYELKRIQYELDETVSLISELQTRRAEL